MILMRFHEAADLIPTGFQDFTAVTAHLGTKCVGPDAGYYVQGMVF